jgi:hypothetical protein
MYISYCMIYNCEKCNFVCNKKSNFTIHKNTIKHVSLHKNENDDVKCICGKQYKHNSNLEKHKKLCVISQNEMNFKELVNENIYLITNTPEFKNMIVEQQKQLQENIHKQLQEEQKKMISEISAVTATTNANTNNINNSQTNNHFNMNMFLNETCKDAMNLSDFMKNLTVTMEDMELTGQLGFVKGMTRIIVNNLNALDVCKRPIHCSDAKRETLYVKNNGVWEKETDDKEFTKALIRRVRHLSDIQLSKWRYLPKNKGFERYDHHKNSEFLTLVYEIHQFREEEIDKLIRNIIRHVVIDKVKMCGYLKR